MASKYCLLIFIFYLIFSCKHFEKHVEQLNNISDTNTARQQLYNLEKSWLKYEFAADTASIVSLMDEDFIVVSPDEVTDKKTELDGVYKTVMKMKADSISIDSFKIEEPFIVKEFDHSAIVVFVCHTYKTSKAGHSQRRTRFYDVWKHTNGVWKAKSSQATTIEEIK